MTRPPQESDHIEWVSATSYERLQTCALRAAFARSGPQDAVFSTAAAIGTLVHGVFEELVRTGAIRGEDWSSHADDLWDAGLRRAAAEAAVRLGHTVDPTFWPDLNLKRARLRRSLVRLRSMILTLPADSVLLPEEPLQALGGLLQGTADLIVRGPWKTIIDYKSGGILDDLELPRESYVRQLHLYALMEHETTGDWPDELVLMPLTGEPVRIPTSPDTSLELGQDAVRLLTEYEARVPGAQPATVAVEVCSTCPHAVDCPPFWAAYDASWGPWVLAVQGPLEWIQRSNGMATMAVISGDGNTPIIVRGVQLFEQSELEAAESGTVVAVTGLVVEDERGTTRLSKRGHIRVHQPATG
jgi:RecB family exonuclease